MEIGRIAASTADPQEWCPRPEATYEDLTH